MSAHTLHFTWAGKTRKRTHSPNAAAVATRADDEGVCQTAGHTNTHMSSPPLRKSARVDNCWVPGAQKYGAAVDGAVMQVWGRMVGEQRVVYSTVCSEYYQDCCAWEKDPDHWHSSRRNVVYITPFKRSKQPPAKRTIWSWPILFLQGPSSINYSDESCAKPQHRQCYNPSIFVLLWLKPLISFCSSKYTSLITDRNVKYVSHLNPVR